MPLDAPTLAQLIADRLSQAQSEAQSRGQLLELPGLSLALAESIVEHVNPHLGDGGAALRRVTRQVALPALPPGQGADLDAVLAGSYLLLRAGADVPCRVRLYNHPDYRDADRGRTLADDPAGEHGLAAELVLSAANPALDLSPVALGHDLKSPRDGVIALRVDNVEAAPTPPGTLSLEILALE